MKLLWLLAAILVLAASWVVYADEPEELWADDLNKALSRAQKSNKPVLLVIRNAHSVASIDVGHWLKDIEYAEHVGRFEPAMVWEGHPSLQTLHLHGRPALVFLTAKGELISSEEAPQFRAQMKERLDGVLLNPVPLDKLYENCLVEMKKGADSPTIDTTNFKRTIEILRATGNADRALPLQQVLNGVKLLKKAEAAKAAAAAAPPASEELKEKPPEREEEFQKKEGETDKEAKERQKKEKKEREKREKELKEKEKKEKKEKEKREKEQGDKKSEATLPEAASEEDEPIEFLEAEARQHVAGHLVRAVRTIEAFSSGEKPENRPPHVLLKAGVARAAQVMNREDANSVKAVTDADAALDAYAKESSDENLKNARKALGVLVPGLNAAAGALQKQANDIFEKFYKANPEHWRTKFNAYTQVWREYNKSRDLEKVRAAMAAVIGAPMSREVLAEVAGHLMNGVIQLELDTERALIAERLQRELTTGRGAADVFLDLADLAVERGQREDAFKLYGMAEQAADGESPVLYRTVRAMRALVDGKGSPNETRWAKRDVKDVVVLVEDYEGYLQAISQWTDKEFFPVLFADDLYAPKFVAAFKPAQVVFWPAAERERSKGGPGPVPSIDQIRKTLLQSWSTDGEKKGPETVTDADLLARLKKLDAKSMGVVFGDGESGEMAGGIALAAGRFQGFEVLPRPTVGGENKIGDTEHYMDVPRITALARKVAEGLQKWGLPSESRWATVTLAGRYPFRFIGVPSAWGYGTTYTVDDLLGRGEDMMRLAVTSRLMGDAPRSAYQAMCSMFLQPETALLFNTYGYDPNNR
ncbi:MAG TPA: hypothetical protein VEJ63_21615, partial [Planctomycetota bacterium]|nr:hypothetical protein [Planctomycetota bacterium]